MSCLYTACQHGYMNIVKYVLERGGEKLLMLATKVSVCCYVITLWV